MSCCDTKADGVLQKNHLSGLKRKLLKLSFWNEQQLGEVKRECLPLVRRNRCSGCHGLLFAQRDSSDRLQADGTA